MYLETHLFKRGGCNMVLGTNKEILTARSTDKKLQRIVQDGGIASAILCFALEENIIDGAVVAGPSDESWKPEPMVALTSEEILAAAGTKYTLCPNVWMLKQAVRQYGLEKVGVVSIPCQTMGIRKMQSYPFGVRFLADKIALNIGIFCTENFSYESLRTFIVEKAGLNFDLVEKMDIGKGKLWIKTEDDLIKIPLKETQGYEQNGCKVCLDLVSELSDLSTGSIGAPDHWSTVIVRTDAGETIFKQALQSGAIETKPLDKGKFGLEMLTRLSAKKKEKALKVIDERKDRGLPVPYQSSSEMCDPLAMIPLPADDLAMIPLDEDIDSILDDEKYGSYPFYALLLYSSVDEAFYDFVRTKGGWIHSLSGDDCLIGVFENPTEWGGRWEGYWRRKLGPEFDNMSDKWLKLEPYDRDAAYDIATELKMDKSTLPCMIFLESLEDNKFLYMPIISDESGYIDYFKDIFTAVQHSKEAQEGERLKALRSEWRKLWIKWILPEKAEKWTAEIKRYGSMINDIESTILSIIPPTSVMASLKNFLIK
jgi:coenzyme F420 hydrogenase subunit beta